MTLEEVVAGLDKIPDTATIYAAKSPNWSVESEAEVHPTNGVIKSRFPYFLEVSVGKDVLRAWSFARNGKSPDLQKKCEALIYFAENDAYLLPESESH